MSLHILDNFVIVTVLNHLATLWAGLAGINMGRVQNHTLPRPFFAGSSSFFGVGLGGGAPPLGPKKVRMSGMAVVVT